MGITISTIIIILIAFLILKSILSLSIKIIGLGILVILTVFTIWICSEQPKMHKPFSMDTIEYLFKINKDGSLTTTKQITRTVVTEGNK